MMHTDSGIQNLEAHRPAITGHCYRMLGSFFDAEDATQEALLRAWKGLEQFDGRASVKNWLYRIATNVCLDEIHSRGRRARPIRAASHILTRARKSVRHNAPAGHRYTLWSRMRLAKRFSAHVYFIIEISKPMSVSRMSTLRKFACDSM